MAVNYANALQKKIGFGALVATRAEGVLKNQLDKNVRYGFLNRKSTFDFKALFLLRRFVVQNKITHIHAHSSSVFFGVLLKFLQPKLQLIWHDHYGKSEMLDQRPVLALKMASLFVSKIIAVNYKLKDWAKEKLWCSEVAYLPNFTRVNIYTTVNPTILRGKDGKRIVCLANLRPQKNHKMLLKVAQKIKESHPDWTFHLIGKDFNDAYSKSIKDEIETLELTQTVFLYGSKEDISTILNQATIGVLTSSSEGLPVAVLEYGFCKLPVISTRVGEIPAVISEKEGYLITSDDVTNFAFSLKNMIDDFDLQTDFALKLHEKIIKNYSEESVLEIYLKKLK